MDQTFGCINATSINHDCHLLKSYEHLGKFTVIEVHELGFST